MKNDNPENILYVLKWLGIAPESKTSQIAKDLSSNKLFERKNWAIRLVCFGKSESKSLHPKVLQITNEHVIKFMIERLETYNRIKRQHEQWDGFMKEFYERAVDDKWDVSQILNWLSDSTAR